MAGQNSPKRANREKFGIASLDIGGAVFFAGLFARPFAGLSPASFSPARSPAKGVSFLASQRFLSLVCGSSWASKARKTCNFCESLF